MHDATDRWLELGRRASFAPDVDLRPDGVRDDDWRNYLDTVAAPLAGLLETTAPRIVGLSGPPGSGKTTLARLIAASIGRDVLALSMDDFYLPRTERARRGMAWRGPPGSHDLSLLTDVLTQIRARRVPVSVPRFDASADDRSQPMVLESPPDLVLLDGWFLGYPGDGYGRVREHLDLLVFLDVDTAASRTRRFAREDALRQAGGGFSQADMQRFWDEVLGPGIERWTREAQASADIVVTITGDQRASSVSVRDVAVLGER